MKVILLDPNSDAEQQGITPLKNKGVAVLHANNAMEAWQLLQLHGVSVDLAIVHLEGPSGTGEPGLDFVRRYKKDPTHSDLPYILTTQKWSTTKCAEHQESDVGANAYLRYPYKKAEFLEVVEGVTGVPFEATGVVPAADPNAGIPKEHTALEDVGSMFTKIETHSGVDEIDRSDEAPAPPIVQVGTGQKSDVDIDVPTPAPPVSGPPPVDSIPPPPSASKTDSSPYAPSAPSPTHITISRTNADAPVRTASAPNDPNAEQEMPYLFNRKKRDLESDPLFPFAQPQGNAVVPGGADESPDEKVLKKYLLLREKDVAALSTQLKDAASEMEKLRQTLKAEETKGSELKHQLKERDIQLRELEQGESVKNDELERKVLALEFKLKERTDKAKVMEAKVREATEELERIKERVRSDIHKIRAREKELENRLEILRKDSEVLIGARENRIIELKRKLDIAEFNLDLLQERFSREKEVSSDLKGKLSRVGRAMKIAGGLIGPEEAAVIEPEMPDVSTKGPDPKVS